MSKRLLSRATPKAIVSLLIIAATVIAGVMYFKWHPEYISQLRHVSPWVVVALVGVNLLLIVVLAAIFRVTAQLAGIRLGQRENLLLTVYSSVANFFGPLQSGPGVRAVYLKRRHHIRLRDYTLASFIYYALYACISALFLCAMALAWWQTAIVVLSVGAVGYGVVRFWSIRSRSGRASPLVQLRTMPMLGTLLATWTLVQLFLVALRYHIELTAIGAHVSFADSIAYAGAANFALFVSITPDGVGIREAFLLAAQQIHGISTHYIVAASLLDRASYVFFLGVLVLLASSLHLKKRLAIGAARSDTSDTV